MRVQKLFLSGKFDDCFLYRGRIVLFTQNGSVKMVSLRKITDHLEVRAPQSVPTPSMLFRRNDWLTDPLYQSAIANPDVAKAFWTALEKLPEEELNPDDFLEKEHALKANYYMLLDCTIYNGRIYIGTDEALYSSTVDWKDLQSIPPFDKRHDAKIIDANARYGTVNFSAGTDGLFSSINEFGLGDQPSDDFRRTAKVSLRSDWCKFELVNYPDINRSELYATKHVGTASGLEYEKSLLTGILTESPKGLEHMGRTSENPRTFVEWPNVDYVFNANQLFFAHLSGGDLYRIAIRYPQSDEIPVISSIRRVSEFSEAKIISTNPVGVSVLIETFNKVFLLHQNGILPVLDRSVLSIRTYPQSRQYRRLATAVVEDGVWLLSVYDETVLTKAIGQPKPPSWDDLL